MMSVSLQSLDRKARKPVGNGVRGVQNNYTQHYSSFPALWYGVPRLKKRIGLYSSIRNILQNTVTKACFLNMGSDILESIRQS